MSAIAFDPLIAEAKQRARRRYLLLALGVAVVAAALGTALETQSRGNSLGLCATIPSGWKVRRTTNGVTNPVFTRPAIVLTNFRFGRTIDLYGLTDRLNWPANGVTVAVINEGRVNYEGRHNDSDLPEGPLRVSRADFRGLEGSTQPAGGVTVRSQGVRLGAYFEVGALTPATIAAANQALASVRTCSA